MLISQWNAELELVRLVSVCGTREITGCSVFVYKCKIIKRRSVLNEIRSLGLRVYTLIPILRQNKAIQLRRYTQT